MSNVSHTLSGKAEPPGNSQEDPTAERREAGSSRSVQRLLIGLTVVGFVLPVTTYFWLIHHYGVNAIWDDQWHDIQVIAHPSVGNLWAQYYEARIFFPNLIVVLLAHTTSFNIVDEEYLSGIMLVVAAGLFILAHKRRSRSTPWIYYCPVVIVMLSFVQAGNALYGFQMGWCLVMVALAVALFALDRPTLSWWMLAGAIAAAAVASFSLVQGLLIWIVGLVLLYSRRRSRALVVGWIASAIVTGGIFAYHYDSATTGTNNSYALSHPIAAIQFFFSAIGDVVGVQLPFVGRNDGVLALGIVIVAVGIWVVITGIRPQNESGGVIGVALVCFGLLFAATITAGRASYGLYAAGVSRYTTFDLLILVGCYMAMLDRPPMLVTSARWHHTSLVAGRVILAVALFLVLTLGTRNGLAEARSWHKTLTVAAEVTANIDKAPDSLVESTLYPDPEANIGFVRTDAQIARAHHLSLFGTLEAAHYAKKGLPVESLPVTSVTIPKNGATLKGVAGLWASASESFGPIKVGSVSKVEFQVSGSGLNHVVIGVANSTYYGYLDEWNTTTIPDGTYSIRSVAYNSTGKIAYSLGITVMVRN